MPQSASISVEPLGQSGFRFSVENCVFFVDPYLSNYVEEVEGARARRLLAPKMDPSTVEDADWVLLTHAHIDHCDPKTVVPISKASPQCKFIGPWEVVQNLLEFGLAKERVFIPGDDWIHLSPNISVRAVIAAHPEIDRNEIGQLRCVGFVFKVGERLIYHSGDTSLVKELIDDIRKIGPIDTAFISVNERNYFRDIEGIIGNMSVRDAFGMAEIIQAKTLVPMHWDMFAANQVFVEEIELLYEKTEPGFRLLINPLSV